jgi:hypothetical protein
MANANFFDTPLGKRAMIAGCVLALVVAFVVLRNTFGDSAAVAASKHRPFVCSETGKPFDATVEIGTVIPVHSPFSGKDTGFPAELCYWNADGSVRKKPTYVLIKEYLQQKGPTFCPDCGRLVVGHNPTPEMRPTPPPTEAEYAERHSR